MANRKGTTGRNQSRSNRRRGTEAEEASKAEQNTKAGDAEAEETVAQSNGENEKVSSMLETTSQEVKQLLEAADDAAKQIRQAARTDSGRAEEAGEDAGDDDPSTVIASTNREVRQVLESADEAAEKIRDEAHAEARQFVEDARRRAEEVTTEQIDLVTSMSEQVMGELSAMQGQLVSLRQAYDESIRTMSGRLGGEETQDLWDTQSNGVTDADEESEVQRRLGRRQRRKEPSREPDGISEGARLLALQQLMAGVDASVIESRLKKEFGIENPGAILDWMGIHSEPESHPGES
jgi:F0F1-type ATP synthase membrane subunit b/b'